MKRRPIVFEGVEFYGIKEFDCCIVHLFTEKTLQGTFMTQIPISSKHYRIQRPTKAKVEMYTNTDWTLFKIYSDWGDLSEMKIHNSLSKEIEFAKEQAIENGLMAKPIYEPDCDLIGEVINIKSL